MGHVAGASPPLLKVVTPEDLTTAGDTIGPWHRCHEDGRGSPMEGVVLAFSKNRAAGKASKRVQTQQNPSFRAWPEPTDGAS